jgi:phosphoribosylformimino-5-aminoimidazole carboxamide ribotide isomerase
MSFTIYPAIDILGGRCVRLLQGDYAKETVYNQNPIEVAKAWAAQGARWIHTVDLDGAKAGHPVNHELIGEIARAVDVPVQLGGGLRTLADVELLLGLGVARVIIGTAALEQRTWIADLLAQFGDRIVIGLDARNGYVATRGWLETSEVKATDLARELAEYGAKTFIFTDISRDGMMEGPNIAAIRELALASGQSVIASGGVSQTSDLLDLAKHTTDGISGAIVGKALYERTIDLATAQTALDQAQSSMKVGE